MKKRKHNYYSDYTGGRLFSYIFMWRGETFQGRYFATAEGRDKALATALHDAGWTPRRWFQVWRWLEAQPSDEVVAAWRKNYGG